MLYLSLFLAWALYAALQGVYDAGAFAHTSKAYPARWNPHIYFLPLRLALLTLSTCTAFYHLGADPRIALLIVAQCAAYPWLHDGFYYTFRGRIDTTGYTFTSTSTTSTATLTLSYNDRALLALLSLLCVGACSLPAGFLLPGLLLLCQIFLSAAARPASPVHNVLSCYGILTLSIHLALTFFVAVTFHAAELLSPDINTAVTITYFIFSGVYTILLYKILKK